jgi:NAD(P)-dependent dehydrogenase (short-subunit alcohol dehydrogenase family)
LITKTIHHDTYPAIAPKLSDMTGRTVFITGASRGLGRTMAVSFTQARVSGLCISARGDLSETKAAIAFAAKAAGVPEPKLLVLQVDVTDQTSVEDAAKAFAQKFPDGLDVLVNNAGNLEPVKKIHESDPKEWWKTYEINVKGTYLVVRSFIPELLKKSSGLKTITNLTSIGAHIVIPHMSSYNSGKLAVCRFTEYIQTEYMADGIIAFSYHPGGVPTAMGLSLPSGLHALLTDTPELTADTLVWLTAKRKEWLGGLYVDSNWDMPEFEKRKDEILQKGLLKVKLIE